MSDARLIEKNHIDLQVYRLEQLQTVNAKGTREVVVPIEQALALAYIARELARRP